MNLMSRPLFLSVFTVTVGKESADKYAVSEKHPLITEPKTCREI